MTSIDRINLDLVGKKINIAYPHPVRKITNEIYDFFVSQGYQIYEGPEIDSEVYNFDKLNMPKDHPARSFQDTFYLKNMPSLLLRTHSSNCQARVMEMNKNHEIKVVSAGKTYRRDDDDATHSHQYTNLEVIAVGKKINFMNLKGTLELFFK
jgi:phenylalanyl-tRNA synthetase alpha chain